MTSIYSSRGKIKEMSEIGELNQEKFPMLEELKVDDWSKMKLLFHPDRKRIISECSNPGGVSIKILSEKLNLNPGSIHNHIKKLHQAGIVRIIKRSYVKGIEEKRYQLTAKYINIQDISEEDKKKRNLFISKDIQKEVVSLLDANAEGECLLKNATVYLSEEDYQKAKKMLGNFIQFINDKHDSGKTLYSFIVAAGKK